MISTSLCGQVSKRKRDWLNVKTETIRSLSTENADYGLKEQKNVHEMRISGVKRSDQVETRKSANKDVTCTALLLPVCSMSCTKIR